jgi:hypothetical protein
MMSKIALLEALIPKFAENKSQLDKYEKLCEADKTEIKQTMADYALQRYETDNYTATRSVSERESFNEAMLLDIVRAFDTPELGLIKTKEYVDFDALEAAIYNDRLGKDNLLDIQKAKETKIVVTLRVSKKRKKKESKE